MNYILTTLIIKHQGVPTSNFNNNYNNNNNNNNNNFPVSTSEC